MNLFGSDFICFSHLIVITWSLGIAECIDSQCRYIMDFSLLQTYVNIYFDVLWQTLICMCNCALVQHNVIACAIR